MDFQQTLRNWGNALGDVVPKLVAFIAILAIGWIIARLLQKLVDVVLERVGFDRMVERGVVGDTLRRSKYDASSIVAKIVFYLILLIALQLAFSAFGPNPVSTLLSSVVAWLPLLIVAIVIIVVAAAIAGAVRDLISTALSTRSYGRFVANAAAVFILALGIIAALAQVGIATAITGPLLIAVLATIGAILAIGVGGGMIRPMEARWNRWLEQIEQEARTVPRGGAYERGREDAARGGPVPAEPGAERPGDRTTPSTTTAERPGGASESGATESGEAFRRGREK
ncbi:hypothetical protein DPM19_12170 [Actinomadura craniellae]|uniref:Uncharacterized protein n=1 Tax=Actinomadura craniellae TaxID=2231787 RepID=A0A365H6A5_9ACTN|nr:hypothetical protein [Actinomadura craniellae]RAY14532.1 hypothetical protein DPM19_12170 [Actinomadura craniellae]